MLKIIAGTAKGRLLKTPKGTELRPTLGKVREALFSMLEAHFGPGMPWGEVSDLYAGTGALGLEALSRGATHCTFFESEKAAQRLLEQNLQSLGFHERASLLRGPLPKSLSLLKTPQQVIFCDPPYYEGKLPVIFARFIELMPLNPLLRTAGVLVAQGEKSVSLENQYGSLHLLKKRDYGETTIFLYEQTPPSF